VAPPSTIAPRRLGRAGDHQGFRDEFDLHGFGAGLDLAADGDRPERLAADGDLGHLLQEAEGRDLAHLEALALDDHLEPLRPGLAQILERHPRGAVGRPAHEGVLAAVGVTVGGDDGADRLAVLVVDGAAGPVRGGRRGVGHRVLLRNRTPGARSGGGLGWPPPLELRNVAERTP
jgi:hypothetical protein